MGEPLKPCPFCGVAPTIDERKTIESKKLWTKLICDNPGCTVICATNYHDDPVKADDEWNRRVPDPRIAKLEGLLRRATDQLETIARYYTGVGDIVALIARIKQELPE